MGKKKNLNYDFEKAKLEYREFCEEGRNDIQIFAQPWYLDTVCDSPDDWKVIIYKENNKIVATFPFEHKKGKRGLWHIRNPWQAPRLGIWINYEGKNIKKSTKESFENKAMQYIIDHLPYFDKFKIAFDRRFINWQPFYNNGFTQQTNYSYFFEPSTIDRVKELSDVNNRQKSYIRAYNDAKLEIDMGIDRYLNFIKNSYLERGKTLQYNTDRLEQLIKMVGKRKQLDIGYVNLLDDVAVICIFYDNDRGYKMFESFITTSKGSPQAFLTNIMATKVLEGGRTFDFEGSMLKGVAEFNRTLGASKEAYFVISKYSSKYMFLESFRTMIRSLKSRIKGE